jgi:hypothetical protein
MKSEKETSLRSPVATSMPLHFIQPPVYAQVSHSAGALTSRHSIWKKLVEKSNTSYK